jgi:hypothetical protein
MQSGLDDGIRLGVDRAHTVTLDHQVPHLFAVRQTRGGAVEAGGQDAFF